MKSVDAVAALVAIPHMPGVGELVAGYARWAPRFGIACGNEVTPTQWSPDSTNSVCARRS